MTANAEVNGAWVPFGKFKLNIEPPVQTPIEEEVAVEVFEDVLVIFESDQESYIIYASSRELGLFVIVAPCDKDAMENQAPTANAGPDLTVAAGTDAWVCSRSTAAPPAIRKTAA